MPINEKEHKNIINSSHQRSEIYGVEKKRIYSKKILTENELSSIKIKKQRLIEFADPFIDSLYEILKESGFIILLTDEQGCILKIQGNKQIIRAAQNVNMKAGAYMDEESIGTNAMGTAIKEDVSVQVTAKEHFITAYHKWTCSAAPIHNTDGKIIGTLNLTATSDKVHPHTLGLVKSTVKAIEIKLRNQFINNQLVDTNQFTFAIMNSVEFGIFALDLENKIQYANDVACQTVNIRRRELIDKHISKLIESWGVIEREIEIGKNIRNEDVLINTSLKKEKFSISVYPIKGRGDKTIGIVISVREMQRIFNIVNKYTGMQAHYTFDDIVYKSNKMLEIINYSKAVSDSPSTILIQGDSGTGKEVFAQSIHNASSRSEHGFVAINCGAIPENLIESELFGYEQGAFTGAKKGGHPGKFELANKGTLFLDEIGEMHVDMQVKLLRAIQEGSVVRVGGEKLITVDVRIIAATNKNLLNEIDKGNFRRDLYYRLSVIPLQIPLLKDRREDIPLLIKFFLKQKSLKLTKKIPSIDKNLLDQLNKYDWPGNIRELENFIEKIVNLDGKISFNEFVEDNSNEKSSLQSLDLIDTQVLHPIDFIEEKLIIQHFTANNKNVSKTSKSLGISRNTLYQKFKKYNIT
ncbi:MAG: sigma-54-dependent Fis family transcriptional regulator [Bacteroidetes bacterium]|nr:sigma-54-dependent Fis family transcriptional regulator [Bacteroidota bacterium]